MVEVHFDMAFRFLATPDCDGVFASKEPLKKGGLSRRMIPRTFCEETFWLLQVEAAI
jgi:hypothetical protein